jgi:hypothetical protein
LAFLTQNKAKLCKNLIITLVFEKNANFFAENRQKSQKIVFITSVPDFGPRLPTNFGHAAGLLEWNGFEGCKSRGGEVKKSGFGLHTCVGRNKHAVGRVPEKWGA